MYSQRSNGIPGAAPPGSQKQSNLSAPFKTQEISIGSMIQVHVTHVASPDLFQVQLSSSEEPLNNLMDSIHSRYTHLSDKDMSLKSFAVGQACIALFSADESWYRAKITGLSGANLVEVYFVDYGNTEIVSPSKVKVIAPDLLDLPAQALPCCLADVSPPSGFWPPEQSTQFEDISLDQTFTACLKNRRKEDGIFSLKLYSESGEYINETFGEKTQSFGLEGDSVVDIKRKIKLDNSGDNIQVTVNTTNSKSRGKMQIQAGGDNSLNVLVLVVGKTYEVTVVYAKSPNKFWCHLAHSDAELNIMTNRLNDVYHAMSGSDYQLSNPQPGEICVAKFKEDNSWYRALVKSADSVNAEVYFIDFGNSEIMTLNNLKVILPEYKDVPAQAIQCMLGNVRPSSGEWSEDALTLFEDLVCEKEMEIKILAKEGQTHIVTLMDSEVGSDIGEKFIQSNFAISSSVSKIVNPYGDMKINFPSEAIVYLSWADNPESFWIQLADNQTALEELTEQIQMYCSKDGLSVARAQPGFPVLGKYTEDESWYRGTILSLRGSKANVLFVDYGNTDLLPIGTLLEVPPELLNVCAYSLHCRLDRIRPVQSSTSWIVDATDLLGNFTTDGATCRFIRQDGDKAVVELLKDNLNIEDQLVKSGVARLKHQNTSNSNARDEQALIVTIPKANRLSPGVVEKVYVSHIETVNYFWCQLSRFLDELDSLMEKLEFAYLQGDGEKVMPEPGLPCAAKFSEDEAWYRAEVLSVDGNRIKVFFVDYGNTDTVGSNDICILNAEFLTLPRQAICCRLDIDNPNTDLGDDLNDLVFEKEVDLQVLSVNGDVNTVDIIIDSRSATSELCRSTSRTSAGQQPVIVKFPPPKPPVGDKTVHAYVSCIVSPWKLYLQVSGCDDDLADISQKLKDYCSTNTDIPDVNPEDGCSALFAEDNEWYRAKVLTCQGSEVTVLFIDYGNTETVNKNNLRFVPPELADIPPFGLECSLDDLAPLDGYDWPKEATEYLESIALDHELICGFLSSGAVIATVNSEELGDKMVDAGFAQRLNVPPAPKKYEYPSRPEQEVKAYITHIDPDGTFYVQLLSMEKEIIQFAILMQRLGKGASRLSPQKKLEKGLVCCAQFSADKNWYRALLESVKDMTVTVRFVDYGNCDEVQVRDLRETTKDMMALAVQAFPCKLKNLTEWSDDIQNRFNEMTDEITLNFLSDSPPFEVEAKTKRGKDIADLLLNPPRPRVYARPQKPTNEITAYISHVAPDHIITFQNIKDVDAINEISEKIAKFPAEEVPERLNAGYACGAKYSEDGAWYRAIVTKVGTKNDVILVDFGNGDSVSLDDLKELPEEMLDIPPFAITCRISGIDKWTKAASELLDSYIEKEMTVSFLSETSPYLVKVVCEDQDLSRVLLRAEVKTYPRQNVPNQVVLGFICHIEDDGRFYVHWNEHEATLENLSTDLQEYYESADGEFARNLYVGQPCCAKFSSDEAWYRAEVLDVVEDKVKVFFCDFGNTEIVSCKDVKYMEKKFIQHAPFAFACRLNESGTWTKKKQEKFESMTKGKTLNIQFVTRTSPYMVIVTRSLADDLNDLSVNEEAECGTEADENEVERTDVTETESSRNENLENNSKSDATHGKNDLTLECKNTEYSVEEITPQVLDEFTPKIEKSESSQESTQTYNGNGSHKEIAENTGGDGNHNNAESECFIESQAEMKDGLKLDDNHHKQNNETSADNAAKETFNVDYKVEKLLEGSRITVDIGHVNSPSDFYVLPQKSHKKYEEMVSELNEVYNGLTEDEEQLTTPTLHEPVAVYCNVTESWQRGRIEDIMQTSCKIYYVDYGNVEETELATVRNLRREFLSLPLRAIECSLAGVQSCDSEETWSERAIEDFVEMTANKKLLVDVIKVGEAGNCLVQIMDMGISLSKKLIDMQHGKSASTPICISKKVKRIFSDSQSPAKRIKMGDDQQTTVSKLKHLSDDLHLGEKIHATVCHIENPSDFWCHLTFAEDALTSLMEKLQTMYCKDSDKPHPDDLNVGDLGVIRSTDSKFYRAEILMISAENKMEVRLIDYGRTLSVPLNEFLCLEKEFYDLPSQAICCRLYRVVTPCDGWGEEVRSKFAELVADKELVLVNRKKLPDKLCVDLFDKEDSIAQILISSELAVINENESFSEVLDDNFEFGIPSIRLNDDSVLEESKLGVLDYCPLEMDTEYDLEIETENALPNNFHARVILENDYASLFSDIQREMENYKADSEWSPLAGEPCLVKDEGVYCRGRVVSTSDSNIEVYLVDSGNKMEVQHDCVAPIPAEYLKMPAKFIRCQLSEITPVDDIWSQAAIEYFRENIKKRSVGYITSLTEYDCYEVCLSNGEQMDSDYLNRQLVEQGYANVITGSQLEIQMQMEDSFLNETDKMAELEASFQSAAILRENSLGGEGELDDEALDGNLNTSSHSFCVLDQSIDHTKDVILELADKCTNDYEQENNPQDNKDDAKVNESQAEAEADQKEATPKDEMADEGVESKATEAKSEANRYENESSEGQNEATVNPKDNVKNLKDETDSAKSEAKNISGEAENTASDDLENQVEGDMKASERLNDIEFPESDSKIVKDSGNSKTVTTSEERASDGNKDKDNVLESDCDPKGNESANNVAVDQSAESLESKCEAEQNESSEIFDKEV